MSCGLDLSQVAGAFFSSAFPPVLLIEQVFSTGKKASSSWSKTSPWTNRLRGKLQPLSFLTVCPRDTAVSSHCTCSCGSWGIPRRPGFGYLLFIDVRVKFIQKRTLHWYFETMKYKLSSNLLQTSVLNRKPMFSYLLIKGDRQGRYHKQNATPRLFNTYQSVYIVKHCYDFWKPPVM